MLNSILIRMHYNDILHKSAKHFHLWEINGDKSYFISAYFIQSLISRYLSFMHGNCLFNPRINGIKCHVVYKGNRSPRTKPIFAPFAFHCINILASLSSKWINVGFGWGNSVRPENGIANKRFSRWLFSFPRRPRYSKGIMYEDMVINAVLNM